MVPEMSPVMVKKLNLQTLRAMKPMMMQGMTVMRNP